MDRANMPFVLGAVFIACGGIISSAFHMPPAAVVTSTQQSTATQRDMRIITSSSSSALHMATWSNSQAIQEYKDFLDSGRWFVLYALDYVLGISCFCNTHIIICTSMNRQSRFAKRRRRTFYYRKINKAYHSADRCNKWTRIR